MKLSGLHILLTDQCTYECDHCFVWGSPRQTGTLRLEQIFQILHQARDAGVTSIYFEGGEPFLYYAILNKAVHVAYDADANPLCGLLLAGGPAALVSEYNLEHASAYADACHLCYAARTRLRARFPHILNSDQMYGVNV